MSKPYVLITDRVPATVAIPLVVAVSVLVLGATGLFQTWDRAWSDLLIRTTIVARPLPLSPRIFPVDLTDSAERNLGPTLDSREAFAQLFSVFAEGRLSIGMDFLFSGSATPEGDAAMAAQASALDGLVIAVVPVDQDTNHFTGRAYTKEEASMVRSHLWHPVVRNGGRIPSAGTFLLPNSGLAKASSLWGHIGVTADNDGIYRKVPLFFRWEEGYMPSLPLAMAAQFLKLNPAKVEIDAGNEVVLNTEKGAIHIPVDQEGAVWIPFPSTWEKGWGRLKIDTVINAASHPERREELLNLLDNGLIFVADLTTSHKDFGPTPLETVYPLAGIHTSVLNGILNQRFYRSLGSGEVGVLLMVLLGAITFGLKRTAQWALHATFGFLAGALVLWSVGCWWFWTVVPWVAVPLVAVLAAWSASVVIGLQKTHEERTLMVSALSRYFPRALATRVLDEKSVDLKPADKVLTILFSDISGFTKWSSDKSAELVHSFLSDYLESMAQILFRHGGTIDKFMGDGILAFFGDPFDQPDHAVRCVKAALAMQRQVTVLQAHWGEKAGIDLNVRIGINTGRVIVGNLGSMTRTEYTVIGSAVNLAQRMESLSPLGGILVTEATWEATRETLAYSEAREVNVKGYDHAVRAFLVKVD